MLHIELRPEGESYPAITTPALAAEATVEKLMLRMAEENIDPDRIGITFQNFGGKGPSGYAGSKFSFLRSVDALDLSPDYTSNNELYKHHQPWMEKAVGIYDSLEQRWEGGEATEWMELYLDLLAQELDDNGLLPIDIARFHFEVEANITGGTYSEDPIKVMVACEADDRWDTVAVPGFAGKTMLQIWQDAQDEFGWKENGHYVTLTSKVNSSVPASNATNQPYFAWWVNVCTTAINAAVQITVYDVVKNHPLLGEDTKVSNYDHFNMDMSPGTFAYRQPTPGPWTGNTGITKAWRNGIYDFGGFGGFPAVVTSQYTATPLMFMMRSVTCSADFDSPNLYYNAPNPASLIQKKWYEPPDEFDVFIDETWPEINRRYHRHLLEAIHNSGTRAADGIAPWVSIPPISDLEDESDIANAKDECRRTLALLRSKDIREAIMFMRNDERGARVDWDAFKRADAQVFTSSYNDYQLVRGSDLAVSSGEDGVPTPLMNTLPDVDRPTVDIESEALDSSSNITEFVVWLNDIYPEDLGLNGRLLLECQLVPLDPAQDFNIDDWREGIVGKISIWHPGAEDWAPLDSVFDEEQQKGDYRIYLPDNSTRREWDIGTPETPDPLCQYLEDCEGPMAIKFTHIAPAAKTMGFVSKYDLVQFYHVDDSAQWSSMMAGGASSDPYLAADFNYDGVQDSTDVALFTDAWSNLRRSADFNGDGVVNATDLAQFLAASARTSSGGGSSEW